MGQGWKRQDGGWTKQDLRKNEMDAVIVWSDTEGKEYRSGILGYLNEKHGNRNGCGRGRGPDELIFCVAALIRNAGFIERIIVVTENGLPFGKDFIRMNFPEWNGDVAAVTHSELFEGFEGFLPCFSAIAVRTLLYRTKGLSESFMLVNTGCIPIRKMRREDCCGNGSCPRVCGSWEKSSRLDRCRLDELYIGQEEICPEDRNFSGGRIFIPSAHPAIQSRKMLLECLEERKGLLSRNLEQRFNNPLQTDIPMIAANSGSVLRCGIPPGTITLAPCSDADLGKALKDLRSATYLRTSPLSSFRQGQRLALKDSLRALLRIAAWN